MKRGKKKKGFDGRDDNKQITYKYKRALCITKVRLLFENMLSVACFFFALSP